MHINTAVNKKCRTKSVENCFHAICKNWNIISQINPNVQFSLLACTDFKDPVIHERDHLNLSFSLTQKQNPSRYIKKVFYILQLN